MTRERERERDLVSSGRIWCAMVFYCLDHYQIIGSRICMSKVIDLSIIPLKVVHCRLVDAEGKKLQNTLFLFLVTSNDVNLNGMELHFEWSDIKFEWEGFGSKFLKGLELTDNIVLVIEDLNENIIYHDCLYVESNV